MANSLLFNVIKQFFAQPTQTVNQAGGVAYALSPQQSLAQYAATGCFNGTFYADEQSQLNAVLDLAQRVEPEFVARVALYARQNHMKDTPALLLAVLSVVSPGLMAEIFDRVIDSPRMLRTFVQIMRSGVTGRRSLGTLPKRCIQQWLEGRSDAQILAGSVGKSPSLADIVKMVHPKPQDATRAALYAWLIGRPYEVAQLPQVVKEYLAFSANPDMFSGAETPKVPLELLAGLNLSRRHWKQMARNLSWQGLRMNLNTLARHGALEDASLVHDLSRKLMDPHELAKARVLPYQILAAYMSLSDEVPFALRHALHAAMEQSVLAVPKTTGDVWVMVDVSGSMQSPITGHRKGATTVMRCVDVAALIATTITRQNPRANVLAFSDRVDEFHVNRHATVMDQAVKLAALPSGGTDCSLPLKELNRRSAKGDLVIYVSDNESWIDSAGKSVGNGSTGLMEEWKTFQRRNPKAKLVCLDLQPSSTTQAHERGDILNIGGFSDAVFTMISEFGSGTMHPDHWVGEIERINL